MCTPSNEIMLQGRSVCLEHLMNIVHLFLFMSRWGRHCHLLRQVEHRRQGQPCEHRRRSQPGAAGGWVAWKQHDLMTLNQHDADAWCSLSVCPQVKSCQVWTHWAASKPPFGLLLHVCMCVCMYVRTRVCLRGVATQPDSCLLLLTSSMCKNSTCSTRHLILHSVFFLTCRLTSTHESHLWIIT